MTPLARFAVGVVLIAVAGGVGFLAYQVSGPGSPGDGASPVAVGEPEPVEMVPPAANPDTPGTASPESRAAARRVIPDSLPDFTLEDANGVPRQLSDWSGRPLLVNFWATWCAPCRREIPLLMQLRDEHKATGLEVVGVAVDFRKDVLKYAAEMGIDYPLLIGEKDGLAAVDAFGMDMVFPFSVFADSQSRIVAVKVGELHQDEAAFILARLNDIEAGKLKLPAAQQQIGEALRELSIARAKAGAHDHSETGEEH